MGNLFLKQMQRLRAAEARLSSEYQSQAQAADAE